MLTIILKLEARSVYRNQKIAYGRLLFHVDLFHVYSYTINLQHSLIIVIMLVCHGTLNSLLAVILLEMHYMLKTMSKNR